MKNRQNGFTLIELVIVITIIAILAAIALPRYVGLQQDARVAKMQAIYGAIRSAAALARARCEIDIAANNAAVGQCNNAAPQVTMDGLAIQMVNRFPQALDTAGGNGILAATGMTPGNTIATAVDGVFATLAGTTVTITAVGAATPASCQITYTSATAPGGVITPPVIVLTASQTNC